MSNLITYNLVNSIKEQCKTAKQISLLIAFVMESGVKLIINDLKEAALNGAEIQILVGDYLYITQPKALELLVKELPSAEIRMYLSGSKSFHPKAYLFRSETDQQIIVGSSNISKSALTDGVEWNLKVVDNDTYEEAIELFTNLFISKNTIPINNETIKIYKEKYDEARPVMGFTKNLEVEKELSIMYDSVSEPISLVQESTTIYETAIEPRHAQVIALEKLEKTVQQGYDKALVVLATGLGKTYLAAFFAKKYKKILFVVHRDEIIQQAMEAFRKVHPDKTIGLYNRVEKNRTSDILFASVATISRAYHYNKFKKDEFDLIIIDEFHHAAANTYQKIINYFEPGFLLGITATPDRLDNRDIYGICDNNVAIHINFLDAIANNWLSPFKYYGIKDEIDYSTIKLIGNYYDQEELLKAQIQTEYLEKVFREWSIKKQSRTIGFCSSIKQAKFMCEYFISKGIEACTVFGETNSLERLTRRRQLIDGEIEIIFTVDLYNEGVDIPNVDTLLFLRPTESITVFTQQLGRGLRLSEGKSHCVVIDFIGNYKNADMKLKVLKPDIFEKKLKNDKKSYSMVFCNCEINLELSLVNLLDEMIKKYKNKKQLLLESYYDLKIDFGRRLTYEEFYLNAPFEDVPVTKFYDTYFHLLKEASELSLKEVKILEKYKDLFKEIEKTKMDRSYKMVLLLAMLQRGDKDWFKQIKAEEVVPFFENYLSKGARKQIDNIPTDSKEVRNIIYRNPITTWGKKNNPWITLINEEFSFNIKPEEDEANILYDWVKQICHYRLTDYFRKKAFKLEKN